MAAAHLFSADGNTDFEYERQLVRMELLLDYDHGRAFEPYVAIFETLARGRSFLAQLGVSMLLLRVPQVFDALFFLRATTVSFLFDFPVAVRTIRLH